MCNGGLSRAPKKIYSSFPSNILLLLAPELGIGPQENLTHTYYHSDFLDLWASIVDTVTAFVS